MRAKYEKKDIDIKNDRDWGGAVFVVWVRTEGKTEGRASRGKDL